MQRESIQKDLLPLRTTVVPVYHIPCTKASNTTAFPGANTQIGSDIVKPHTGQPIHIFSLKLYFVLDLILRKSHSE